MGDCAAQYRDRIAWSSCRRISLALARVGIGRVPGLAPRPWAALTCATAAETTG